MSARESSPPASLSPRLLHCRAVVTSLSPVHLRLGEASPLTWPDGPSSLRGQDSTSACGSPPATPSFVFLVTGKAARLAGPVSGLREECTQATGHTAGSPGGKQKRRTPQTSQCPLGPACPLLVAKTLMAGVALRLHTQPPGDLAAEVQHPLRNPP